jgi:non-ribosomal peptide synthetase component F
MVGEDAIAGFLDWMAAHERLSRADRVLQNHSIGFDNSIWEMWSPLAGGAALVFPADDERADYERLLRTVERTGVSVLNATPRQTTTLIAVADALELTPFHAVRLLYTGAETVPHAAAERILHALPADAVVANEYGPTEATITCTLGPIDEATLAASAGEPSVPIGHPIGDAILDVRDGELWVGGRCIALGYRDLPQETADRFVVDARGERWYRTGDLVRLTDHGLVFLGRADRQTNVRGHRIELAAVESAAARLPGVGQAAAIAAGGVEGARETLWLFVVPEYAAAVDRDSLRAALARSLPYYMVPDQVVVHEGALPLTVNGKLDVDALLATARQLARLRT